jgi:hypothetical protein
MPANHLAADRVTEIIRNNQIAIHELAHIKLCSNCNGWLRAFAAFQSAHGKKIAFQIPEAPFSSEYREPRSSR